MNKNKIATGLLLALLILNSPVAFAQDYVIPPPQCVDTPEIPCPNKGKSYEGAQKPVASPTYDVPTGFSKLFDYMSSLTTKIGDLADYTKEGLKNWFRNIYDGILHRFGKV